MFLAASLLMEGYNWISSNTTGLHCSVSISSVVELTSLTADWLDNYSLMLGKHQS
jgi:hypothetical protein